MTERRFRRELRRCAKKLFKKRRMMRAYVDVVVKTGPLYEYQQQILLRLMKGQKLELLRYPR